MGTEANPSIYNPGGETTMGLNNSGISDGGHGYFINKEKAAAGYRREAREKLFNQQEKERSDEAVGEANKDAEDQVTDGKGSGTGHDVSPSK